MLVVQGGLLNRLFHARLFHELGRPVSGKMRF